MVSDTLGFQAFVVTEIIHIMLLFICIQTHGMCSSYVY